MKKWKIVLIYILAFIVLFVFGLVCKIASVKMLKPDKWNDSVGSIHKDYSYGDKPLNKFDLYLPADKSKDSYGLVVYLHGGGFVIGDKSKDENTLKYFTAKGYVAAGINYTLRNKDDETVTVPDMSAEIKNAIPIVIEKAKELGYPVDQMVISGVSAGGHLALIYGLKEAESAPVPVRFIYETVGPADFDPTVWQGISDFSTKKNAEQGATFVSLMTGKLVTAAMMSDGSYKDILKDTSAETYVTSKSVPILAGYGKYDKVAPIAVSQKLFKALKENKVPNDIIIFPKSDHFLQNDHKERKELFDKLELYLKKYMPVK